MNTNTGHGHVTPRPDGARARCGGPMCCRVCQQERAALEASKRPHPTADERVAEHMQHVADAVSQAAWSGQGPSRDLMAPYLAAVEQSARALLSASQDDAEHAAMYRWMKENARTGSIGFGDGWIDAGDSEQWDEWILAAMKETK